MKFKLKKSNQAGRKLLFDAIRKGIPLAGLFTVLPLSGGCEKNTPSNVMGSIEIRPALRGDTIQTPLPDPTSPNAKREDISQTPTIAGIPPPPPPSITQSGETQVYLVKSGDTLSAIAKRYDIALDVIVRLNHFSPSDRNKLRVGQKILLPKQTNKTNEAAPTLTMGEPLSK